MKSILFIGRLAIIFNVIFLLYLLGYYNWFSLPYKPYSDFVISTGFVLPIIVNAIFFIVLAMRILFRKGTSGLPRWIIATNLVFYAFQIMFYFL